MKKLTSRDVILDPTRTDLADALYLSPKEEKRLVGILYHIARDVDEQNLDKVAAINHLRRQVTDLNQFVYCLQGLSQAVNLARSRRREYIDDDQFIDVVREMKGRAA